MERLWSLVAVLLLFGQALANPWHFGEDHPNYRVIYQKSGQILPFCYNTRQIITVPPCMTLKYVHVAVYNSWSIPTVKFHQTINVVSIVYGLLQHTKSGYDIVVKGYRTPHCTPGIIDNGHDYVPYRLRGPQPDHAASNDTHTPHNGFDGQNEQLAGGKNDQTRRGRK